MKGFKSLNTKSVIATATSVLVAGAGSSVADWLLAKYNILPEDWGRTAVNAGKVAVGAIAGSMIKNQIAKSAFDGIATVAAAKLVEYMLPSEESTSGLPEGMIGRIHRLGQRGYRRAKVAGVTATSDAFMSK